MSKVQAYEVEESWGVDFKGFIYTCFITRIELGTKKKIDMCMFKTSHNS